MEEIRPVALKELEALRSRRQRMEPLDHNAHPLLELYAGMVSEILDNLTSKEHRSIYKMLQPRVMVSADGPLEITDVSGRPLEACPLRSVKTEGVSLPIPRFHRKPELGFRALLTDNGAERVELVRA